MAFAGSGANLDVTFTYQCTWMDSYGSCYGGVTRTSTGRLTLASTSYICPLGSYACGGTPSTCTAPLACTDRLSCPSGYAVFGSLCTASPSCG